MAEANPQEQQPMENKEEQQRLKYLEFVHVAIIQALLRFSMLYDFAKERTGPLKPGVRPSKKTVKTVVGPVYDKFHEVPAEVLRYVDRKVDESMTELDRRVPTDVKKASSQALSAAQKAPEAARTVVSEVRRAGVVDTASGLAKSVYGKCEPTAKDLYSKYEPKAEKCAVSAWRKLNKLPLFPQMANVIVPTAAYCTEKYNETVVSTAEKGYKVSAYLPLVPTEKIAKIFCEGEAAKEPSVSCVEAH
uniref:Rubber elongation factor n=1 Tax=Copaifera officinalis TaxID=327148 RepID=H2D7G4_9FABA|nr:rubber elongation factor [Copaifera officinalis]